MFPIQEKVIPLLYDRQDVIAQSKTGSGENSGLSSSYYSKIQDGMKKNHRL